MSHAAAAAGRARSRRAAGGRRTGGGVRLGPAVARRRSRSRAQLGLAARGRSPIAHGAAADRSRAAASKRRRVRAGHAVETAVAEHDAVGRRPADRGRSRRGVSRCVPRTSKMSAKSASKCSASAHARSAPGRSCGAAGARGRRRPTGTRVRADVQRAARTPLVVLGDVGVRQVDREQRVVLADVELSSSGRSCRQAQQQAGQEARPLVVEPLLAEADRLDVAVAVEDGERVAVLEHAVAARRPARRSAEDVVAILDFQDARPRSWPAAGSGRCRACAQPCRIVGASRQRRPAGVALRRSAAGRRPRRSRPLANELPVERQVVARHAPRGEALLEHGTASRRSSSTTRSTACDGVLDVVDHEAGDAILHDLGHRAVTDSAITGVPQAMASIITSPNGSGQSIGKSRACALPRNSSLSRSSISPTNSTSGSRSSSGSISASKYSRVGAVDLGGDLERHACAPRDLDGPVRSASPARCGRGTRGSRRAARGTAWQVGGRPWWTVPIQFAPGQRPALRVRDRRPAAARESRYSGPQVGQVEPAMQRA